MGFFSKDDAVPTPVSSAAPLAPLSLERVTEQLDHEGIVYFRDEDNDIVATWDNSAFWFMLGGGSNEFLRVQGRWYATLDPSRKAQALELVNSWNAEKLWPKVYIQLNNQARLVIMTEHDVDYEAGLTDEQLRLHLRCVISTSMQFFEHLAQTFPEEWKQFEAERAQAQAEGKAS